MLLSAFQTVIFSSVVISNLPQNPPWTLDPANNLVLGLPSSTTTSVKFTYKEDSNGRGIFQSKEGPYKGLLYVSDELTKKGKQRQMKVKKITEDDPTILPNQQFIK